MYGQKIKQRIFVRRLLENPDLNKHGTETSEMSALLTWKSAKLPKSPGCCNFRVSGYNLQKYFIIINNIFPFCPLYKKVAKLQ